jgi:hypothetical protein
MPDDEHAVEALYDVEEFHEELDEQGRTVRVITKARLSHISVDPRRQHQDDPRHHRPPRDNKRPL